MGDSPIPQWSISTWVYSEYPGWISDQNTGAFSPDYSTNGWFTNVFWNIGSYNQANLFANSKIDQIYAYVSDVELPWASLTQTSITAPSWSDKTQYGFFFTTLSGGQPNLSQYPIFSNSVFGGTSTSIIIDGRIDNGYLQGFNQIISEEDATCLADIVTLGSSASCCPAGGVCKTITGITAFGPINPKYSEPKIPGVQIDFEPFNSDIPNQQAFYNQFGSNLASAGQYFSIFVYPKSLTQNTADVLNGTNNGQIPSGGARNNGYAIIALYDLVDMKNGIDPSCDRNYQKTDGVCDVSATPAPVVANGDATSAIYDPTVPHSLQGYYNSALLAVKQTIALAKQYNIFYKFAIPVSSSVHEFENWGIYSCQFDANSMGKPNNAYCSSYNTIPMNPNSGDPSQLEYVQQALRAINDGIAQMGEVFDPSLLRGLDLYCFGFKTIWTPQNPLKDINTNNLFYGNTPVFVPSSVDGSSPNPVGLNVPYIYTTPSYPVYGQASPHSLTPPDVNSVLGWLSTQNLDPRPCNSETCPSSIGSCQTVQGYPNPVCKN
jgi:hypothetical protein